MKKILFTTILLVAGVICIAFGIYANSITMSMLGGFFIGLYNCMINMMENTEED